MAQENEQLRNELHHYQRDTLQYRTMVEQLEQQLRQAGIDSETKLAVPKRQDIAVIGVRGMQA